MVQLEKEHPDIAKKYFDMRFKKMGIIDRIKTDATKTGSTIQPAEEAKLEALFNKMFYLDKDIEEETKFIHTVMTRGAETQERIGLHASAIIDKGENSFCVRQQVLSLLYKQLQGEQLPVNTMRVFEEGNAVHEKWQRLFIRAGYAKAKTLDRTRYDEEYHLSFTPDIVCRIPEFYDGAMVGEIKSMNSFSFKKQHEHLSGKKQLKLYMHLLIKKAKEEGRWNGRDYLKGFTLMDSKNDQEFKVRLYDYDPKAVSEYIDRLDDINYYYNHFLETKVMVDRHRECTSYSCKMAEKCPMKDACYNKGIGRIKL